ncbi:MAG TPA: paraslipin [Cyanobacteria bacterium UBA11162]|nr:paraslipin [Cyanobacteria bacterium UBA12227]HAX86135.1 paraslipin [Cyanobacteria bacterium UBA11370]HBL11374.1 paraslipin [Cyanobacteria bacterium UBA11162]HBY77944.1 paraslipin [Cyanobacteria bacterium UBA11148]
MDSLLSILAPMILVIVGYTVGSTKIVNQGNKALVERLGKYNKTLNPGLNFIVPFLDRIAVEETTKEQVLDIEPQQAITKDNISVEVNAVVYWRINNLYKAYYDVEDVQDSIKTLVTTTLRSEIGSLPLDETYSSSSRTQLNKNLLNQLKEAADSWGIEVIRVEVQEITLPKTVIESLEKEREAESEKKAAIARAEGEKKAAIAKAEGTVESIAMISKAILEQPNSRQVLQYLIAQQYVDANQKLGESPNSKVVFMDPKALTEAMTDLLSTPESPIGVNPGNGSSQSPDN